MTFEQQVAFALSQGLRRIDLPTSAPTFERLVRLDGNHNFRDAGGYAGRDGLTMRRGLVFRSDHLADLTNNDLGRVADLGIRVVHDFRLTSERDRQPSRLPDGPRAPVVQLLAAADAVGLDETMIEVIRDMLAGRRALPPPTFWETNYLQMLTDAQRMLVAFLRSIADADRLPSVHHCTGGKDRTGVSTALLHRLLGVNDEDIFDDFLLTNLYRTPFRVDALRLGLAEHGIDVVDAIPILGVTRQPLRGVLQYWDDNGGAEAYALDGGATPNEIERLRQLLLISTQAT